MWSYIDSTRELINDLWVRVQTVMGNIDKVCDIGDTWQVPLFERKEGKAENLIELENRAERVQKRYDTIRSNAHTIHQLIQVNNKLNEPNQISKPAITAQPTVISYTPIQPCATNY